MQEPSNEELKRIEEGLWEVENDPMVKDVDEELEEEDDDLDPLDALLDESMALSNKKKVTKRGRTFWEELPALTMAQGPHWNVEFSCAIFIKQICEGCGDTHLSFSHFAEFQKYTLKSDSHPSRWTRVDTRPADLANPRLIEKKVPICSTCHNKTYIPFIKS